MRGMQLRPPFVHTTTCCGSAIENILPLFNFQNSASTTLSPIKTINTIVKRFMRALPRHIWRAESSCGLCLSTWPLVSLPPLKTFSYFSDFRNSALTSLSHRKTITNYCQNFVRWLFRPIQRVESNRGLYLFIQPSVVTPPLKTFSPFSIFRIPPQQVYPTERPSPTTVKISWE